MVLVAQLSLPSACTLCSVLDVRAPALLRYLYVDPFNQTEDVLILGAASAPSSCLPLPLATASVEVQASSGSTDANQFDSSGKVTHFVIHRTH